MPRYTHEMANVSWSQILRRHFTRRINVLNNNVLNKELGEAENGVNVQRGQKEHLLMGKINDNKRANEATYMYVRETTQYDVILYTAMQRSCLSREHSA